MGYQCVAVPALLSLQPFDDARSWTGDSEPVTPTPHDLPSGTRRPWCPRESRPEVEARRWLYQSVYFCYTSFLASTCCPPTYHLDDLSSHPNPKLRLLAFCWISSLCWGTLTGSQPLPPPHLIFPMMESKPLSPHTLCVIHSPSPIAPTKYVTVPYANPGDPKGTEPGSEGRQGAQKAGIRWGVDQVGDLASLLTGPSDSTQGQGSLSDDPQAELHSTLPQ